MTAAKAYRIVQWATGGAADIVDRRTGSRVGFVISHARRWEARRFDESGRAYVVGGKRRYRSEAAGEVWAAHMEAAGNRGC